MSQLIEEVHIWLEKSAQPHGSTASFIQRLADRIKQLEADSDNQHSELLRVKKIDEQLEAKFSRMENAWRNELESWYMGEPNNPPNKTILASLNGKLKEAEARIQAIVNHVQLQTYPCSDMDCIGYSQEPTSATDWQCEGCAEMRDLLQPPENNHE